MMIYIPSRARSGQIANGPLASMNEDLRARCIYVVPPAEAGAYGAKLRNMDFNEPQVVGMEYGSIGEKRQKIAEIAAAKGERTFIMMDDDVGLLVRRSPEHWQLEKAKPGDVWTMLSAIELMLKEVASVGGWAWEAGKPSICPPGIPALCGSWPIGPRTFWLVSMIGSSAWKTLTSSCSC